MNKKYKELTANLEKIQDHYKTTAADLTARRDKTLQDLDEALTKRSGAMEAGNLEAARKLKAQILDLESDSETYGAQLQKLEAEKKAALRETAEQISLQVKETEAAQYAKERAEILKTCANLKKKLEALDADRQDGADLIRKAQAAAGLPQDENISYFAGNSPKRLLKDLYSLMKNIELYENGEPVYGIAGKDWI